MMLPQMLALMLGVILLGIVLLCIYAVRDVYRKQGSNLPPGPRGLPLLGNLLQVPSKFTWYKLDDWSKQYGPIYTLWMMGRPFVVLNSVAVAADILDRNSGATADRFKTIKSMFYTSDSFVSLQDHTIEWRGERRAIHSNLNIRSTVRFLFLQENEAAYFTLGLLRYPDKAFDVHAHRFAGSSIFRSLYGGERFNHLKEDPSRLIEKMHKEVMHAMLPQNSIVDMLPFLEPLIQRVKWLRRAADTWFREMTQEGYRLFDTAAPTEDWEPIVQNFNMNREKYGITKHNAVWTTVTLYMAGQETTSTALRVCMLALLHHPEVMRAAQANIDAICGMHPPKFEDRDKLPYIDALVKETVRWRPGIPPGIPHVASETFQYQQYTIPKGTVFFDNIWGQTRDPLVYPNSEVFNPTRFLDKSGKLLPVTPDTRLDLLGFGHGRRVCPGKDFAVNGMFIAIAYMLWAFTFEWPLDDAGQPIKCDVNDFVDHSFVASPRSFGVLVKPRREDLEGLLVEVLNQYDAQHKV
ncbi:cytochrome P450, partial [Dacryopinax primogenitus]